MTEIKLEGDVELLFNETIRKIIKENPILVENIVEGEIQKLLAKIDLKELIKLHLNEKFGKIGSRSTDEWVDVKIKIHPGFYNCFTEFVKKQSTTVQIITGDK
jgi:hypothetical protein